VKKMIAGPRVQICDECVDICVAVLSEDKKKPVDLEGEQDMGGTTYALPSTMQICGLCRMPTPLEKSLAVQNRGIICAGCVAEIEAAIAEGTGH